MAHNHGDHDHSHEHSHDHGQRKGADRITAAGTKVSESGVECCAHHEIEIERYIFLYLIGGVLLVTTRVAKMLSVTDGVVAEIPAVIGAVLLSIPLLRAAWTEITQRRPSSSTLAALAILAALAVNKYEVAGWLAFILLVADQILRRTAWGARRAIEELVQLTPDTARLVMDGGVEREVSIAEVKVGQTVRVRPGENLPVDGRIITGRSTINQASLTGEAAPAEVQPGDPVYAGTTNLTGGLDITVTQVGADTTIGKVTQLIAEAERSKSPRQLLIEQVAGFFVPVALSVAAIVWFLYSQDEATKDTAALTAVTVLVVACPSALLLASPSAMVAAFAAAARLGVLIKQTHYLEAASNVDAVVFDKTGTITTGKFAVSRLAPAPGVEGADLLKAAANGEQNSNHPLALSILATAKAARVQVDGSTDYHETHGRGARARTGMGEIHVGRASWLVELNPSIKPEVEQVEQRIEGMTGVHVMLNGKYMGAVGLEDKVRPNVRGVIARLRELGVRQVCIFTGDRLSVAKRVGVAVGADAIEAECLPEEKHEQIQQLVRAGARTMMIGDGINDGPSLAAADVGVAMGLGGSDIAANSAGVALMTDELNRIPFMIELARKTRAIVAQNIAASLVIVLIGLGLAATGNLAVWGAGLYHFAGDVFVIANSFRLFRFGENILAAEAANEPQAKRREASIRGLSNARVEPA
ncbi:MAG: cation-translocating P-type ATPase [Phycisphaeraceae bacterium]|nr:MAG: cation-translocating P-type ATPase [Phycisphaeraceae bacterium]